MLSVSISSIGLYLLNRREQLIFPEDLLIELKAPPSRLRRPPNCLRTQQGFSWIPLRALPALPATLHIVNLAHTATAYPFRKGGSPRCQQICLRWTGMMRRYRRPVVVVSFQDTSSVTLLPLKMDLYHLRHRSGNLPLQCMIKLKAEIPLPYLRSILVIHRLHNLGIARHDFARMIITEQTPRSPTEKTPTNSIRALGGKGMRRDSTYDALSGLRDGEADLDVRATVAPSATVDYLTPNGGEPSKYTFPAHRLKRAMRGELN